MKQSFIPENMLRFVIYFIRATNIIPGVVDWQAMRERTIPQFSQYSHSREASWIVDLLLLTILFSLLYFILLGSRPLFTPDEGRYAEMAREMAVSGDYITPYLNTIKYFEKPILFFWLGAAAIKLGGPTILAVRMINAVIAILGCLLTYAVSRQLYGRTAGILSSLILGTSLLYFVMGHMVSLDLPVTVFISASLYGIVLALTCDNACERRWYFWGAALASALAVLTKGLIGVVFPAIITLAWIALMSEWRQFKLLPIMSGAVVFLLIATPWHALVHHHNPEFFHFYFIEQHFLRYTDQDIGHYQPIWFFIPTLLLGFFPWIAFLPQTLIESWPTRWRNRVEYGSELFFIFAAVIIFAFFSFSKSKLIPYILPVIPPLAVLTGRYLSVHLIKPTRGIAVGFLFAFLFSAVITYILWNPHILMSEPAHAVLYLRASLICLLVGSLLAFGASLRSTTASCFILIISTSLFLIFSHGAVQFIDTRTVRPLAQILKPMLQAGDDVISYNQYYQDLPFYLERRVTILNWRNELTFGMAHQDTNAFMIDTNEFWKRWHSKQHVYMVMSKSEYQNFHKLYPRETIILISETPTNVLVTNRPLVLSPT